jgi:hypothetical protein
LKERGQLQDTSLLNYLYSLTRDTSEVLLEAKERQSRILDAHYEKIDPDEFVRGLTNFIYQRTKRIVCGTEKVSNTFWWWIRIAQN